QIGYRSWLGGNLDALDQRFDFDAMQKAALASDPGPTRTSETNFAGFLEANGVAQLAGRDLKVNLGVRGVNTKQKVSYVFNGTPIVNDHSYFELLPSLNASYDLGGNLLARFSASRTMTRPDPSSIEPVTNVSLTGDVSRGNPDLQPYFSNAVDLGLEWYYAQGAALTLAGFYKNIQNFVAPVSFQAPFRNAGVPLSALDPQIVRGLVNGLDTLVTFSTAENVQDRQTLKGVEIGFQQPLSFVVRGLGFVGNATYVEANKNTRINGLSRYAFNVTGYYERDDVNFRISYNYRSKYALQIGPVQDGLPDSIITRGRGQLDLSSSYKLPFLKELSLTFEAINLTNSDEYSYFGVENRLAVYRRPGRQFFFGVRGSF
uniref:TonB-dependent receptor domain-containing protein n=1 Tax=Sphingobium sp. Sx8-8 TaxID=2933617 RepID=UPI001F57A0EA